MAGSKTVATNVAVRDFLSAVEPEQRRSEALTLLDLFTEATGFESRMWGPSMIGFGRYHYVYDSGREGDSFATGFSPRKADLSIYILPGYADYGEILSRLGNHRTGKSCLYVKRLGDIDLGVLSEVIRVGLDDLKKRWPVSAA